MKSHATHSTPGRSSVQSWLPPTPARSLDLTHWLTRAARGHTWNAGACIRRRAH